MPSEYKMTHTTQMTQMMIIAGGSSGDESDVETEPGLTLKRKVSFKKKIILPMMEIFLKMKNDDQCSGKNISVKCFFCQKNDTNVLKGESGKHFLRKDQVFCKE